MDGPWEDLLEALPTGSVGTLGNDKIILTVPFLLKLTLEVFALVNKMNQHKLSSCLAKQNFCSGLATTTP